MTIEAFKKAMCPGMKFIITDHSFGDFRHLVNTVSKVQENCFFYKRVGYVGHFGEKWPQSSELRFDGKTAIIDKGNGRHFTLTLAGMDKWYRPSDGWRDEMDDDAELLKKSRPDE
jgi:hypothetical protein